MADFNSLNKVLLMGRVGKKPEMRHGKEQHTPFMRFTLVTTEVDKGKGKHDDWHNIICFGMLAEFFNKHVEQGDRLVIVGKLKVNKYTDKTGVPRVDRVVHAREIIFVRSGKRKMEEDRAEFAETNDEENGNEEKPPF